MNPVNDTAYCASLNLARDRHWDDKGKWRDPTFISIRFFDIMIHAAACQGIIWHMWLYYIPSVIKSLEEIFEPFDGDARPYGEYPTRAGDLIYACLDALTSWILVASDVDEASPHRAPDNDRVDHENGNIPKSAALALGIAMRTIVMSERIDNDVKKNLLDMSVRSFRELSKEGGAGLLRSSVIKSIAAGGPAGGGPIYRQKLENLYGQIERPWQFDLADFEEAIGFKRWHPAGAVDN